MLEILGYIMGGLTLCGAALGFFLFVWEHWKGHRVIPQNIIDARALSLIAEFGEDAESHAYGTVQRLQWKRDSYEDFRARRILKAIRKHQREAAN